MAKFVKLKNVRGEVLHPATILGGIADEDFRVSLKDQMSYYNVSDMYPTQGVNKSDKFTFEMAINLIPSNRRRRAIKCAFTGTDGLNYAYEYQGGTYTDKANWLLTGTAKTENLDAKINTFNECVDNDEFQQVVIDADGYILEAVKDGRREHYIPHKFMGGFEAPELKEKEQHIDGRCTINVDYAESVTSDDNVEWANATLDCDGGIIEGVMNDGTKYINKLLLGDESLNYIRSVLSQGESNLSYPNQHNLSLFKGFWNYTLNEPDYNVAIINPHVINIKASSEFTKEHIKEEINRAVNAGSKIVIVNLQCSHLTYDEDFFNINKSDYPMSSDVRLFIAGNGTILTAAGADYSFDGAVSDLGDRYTCEYSGKYNPKSVFLDQNGNMINMFEEIRYALSQATLDTGTQTWKLKIRDEDMNSEATHIMVTGDYVAPIYKIEKMEAGYVYFKNPDSYDFAPNGDYMYAQVFPRYALVNSKNSSVHVKNGKIYIKKNITALHECKSSCFVCVNDGHFSDTSFVHDGNTFRSIDISGLKFVGNAYVRDKRLINLSGSRNEHVWVHDCSFKNTFTECLYAREGCANIKVSDCNFVNTYGGGILQIQYDAYVPHDITIVRNTFCNTNLHIPVVSPQVGVAGKNVLVRDNELVDCTASIFAGFYCTNYKTGQNLGGIIEDNMMYFTAGYQRESYKHCYMDCGCIYLTMNDNLHVRNNIVANYTGIKFANAVYCDDGARGLKIYSNGIINNNGNGGADIHSRIVSEKNGNPIIGYNSDNYIGYNILTTWYHFVENQTCAKGTNFVFAISNESIVHVKESEVDCHILGSMVMGDCIKAPAKYADVMDGKIVSEKIKSRVLFNIL